MKPNNIINKLKRQFKNFLKGIKNKNTSFFVLLLCICLISTALIWKYTSSDNIDNDNSATENQKEPDIINANEDPYKDYVDKTINEYEKSLENEKIRYQTNINGMFESFSKPIEGSIAREFNINELVYFEAIEEWRTHQGVDIKPSGNLVVKSTYDGVIEEINNSSIMGYEIVINHGNEIKTVYSCLSSVSVKVGDTVKNGDKIGTLGLIENIEMAEEPHLHYEILVKNENYDPTFLFQN